MSEPNEGAELPAQTNVRWYKVISPKGSEVIKATLLQDVFTGFWVHWEGRVFPCPRTAECRRCREGQANRWSGYIGAFDLMLKERVVLALTEGAARQLLPIKTKYETLRGVTISLARVYVTKNNSKVGVRFTNRQLPDEVMPAHGIHDSLNRLFGLNEQWYRSHVPITPAGPGIPGEEGMPLPDRDQEDDFRADLPRHFKSVHRLIDDTFPTV